MPLLANMSIRRKQTLIIMGTSSVVLLLACAAFSIYEVITFRKAMVQNLSTLAEMVGDNTAAALDFNDAQSARGTLSALHAEPSIIGACVYTKEGRVFASYNRTNDSMMFAPRTLQTNGHAFQGQRLTLSRPIVHLGETVGIIYLESDMQALYSKLTRYAGIVGLVFAASVLIAFVLSNRLQRLVSGPIRQLAQVTRSVALEKNYGLRASKQSNDELGQLVDGFNEMLTQIQARDAALQTARDSLESRVRERTAELAAANQSLVAEIAERKRAEESLRLLGSAVEQAEDSIYITDAQFDQPDSILLFVNPAFTKMTGYTAQEVQGKTPRILYGERTDTAILARLRAALSRGEAFHGELINYRKDGSEFQAEMHVAPIRDAKGAITHFVSIKRDVTERRRFEERLFQSQKMETVGKLAGGVAHEFNSIMTAILGHSELLLFDLPEGNPLRKSASEIHHAADRAAILTRQLLAYGRKQMLQADVLDLNTVLAGMENTLRHIAGRDVDVHIAPSAGPKLVKADPGQIEQVIVNIVMNAADAMPHGGKLTLETAETFLDQQYVSRFADLKPGEYVMVAITDTGAGMSEAVKARLFEPFFTTKEVGKGTGLGLATCHGIIKQSDGHINVYSEPGRGATFKIYLPKVRLEVKPAGPPLKSPGMPRGTETILLVEDDPALRQMAATLLERLGYTLLTAGNGLEALNVTHQQTTGRIDLLFTDVVMPHMSGKELADRVRSLYPQTKILFTSAYTENAFSHQGVLQPGIALLQKPFTPSALAAKVREVLDSEKAAAARQ